MISGTERRLLRVGLVGRGRMGLHHLRIIESNRMTQVVAIADPSIQDDSIKSPSGHKLAVYRCIDELLGATSPDVVHIVTPPSSHFDLTRLSLETGAHVYVEKPFVLHRREAEILYELASKKNLSVCAGHQLLFENPVRTAQTLMTHIGKMINIESYFSFRPVRRSVTAVEQLLDILPHPVYLIVHFLNLWSGAGTHISPQLAGYEVSRTGEVRAIITHGDVYGILSVTLQGRPVESYVRITGTNGSLHLDFVRGTVTKLLGPGASAVSAVLNPYIQASQILTRTTKAFAKLAISKGKGYQGLSTLIGDFYTSIVENEPSPTNRGEVIQTVNLCELLAISLNEQEEQFEKCARKRLYDENFNGGRSSSKKGTVLVTGGTGFLGKEVVKHITSCGWMVRVLTRKTPPFSQMVTGVEYRVSDLSAPIAEEYLQDVSAVIHCAAETAGSIEAHEHNTVKATRNLLEGCGRSGIERFIHISSLAVLKSGRVIDEKTPLDWGNSSRGPYVWAKAEAEKDVLELGDKLNLAVKVIRPGPLVNYDAFQPPGRLGKEVGPLFVAVGSKKSRLSVCDVKMAARVIGGYLEYFSEMPDTLNLVEPEAPTRQALVNLAKRGRPDLRVFWLPLWVVAMMSPVLKLLQRILFPRRKPIDIYAIFASERYNTSRLRSVLQRIELK